MTHAPPAHRAYRPQTSRAHRTGTRDALHAEWTKARTLPGTGWLLLAAVALTVGQVAGSATWHRHLEQLAPMTAGLAIQATTGLRSLPISPWAGLGVLAGWAAAALLAGRIMLRLRDA